MAQRFGESSPEFASDTMFWLDVCASASVPVGTSETVLQAGAARSISTLKSLCKDVPHLNEVESAELNQKSVPVTFSTKLVEIERKHGVDSAMDFAETTLRNAKTPFEAKAAMDYLRMIEVIVPPGRLVANRSSRRVNEVYEMSRDHFLCRSYGGCGGGQPLALALCARTNCAVAGDYRAVVRQQLAPAEIGLYEWYQSIFASLGRK